MSTGKSSKHKQQSKASGLSTLGDGDGDGGGGGGGDGGGECGNELGARVEVEEAASSPFVFAEFIVLSFCTHCGTITCRSTGESVVR